MWQLFILFYFIFGASSYLLKRVLAQKLGEHNRLINTIFYIFFLLPTILVLSFFFPANLNVGTLNLFFLFVGSLIWPLLGLASFRANKEVDVGIFALISNLSPIFTLAVALPFLHESLQGFQFIGVALLIVSGVLAASSHLHKHNRLNADGLIFCFISAIILGIAVAYEQFMLSRIDFGAYLIYGWGSQIIWSMILAGKQLQKLPALIKKDRQTRQTLLAWGSASALRSIAFISALKLSGSASLISAASDFMSVAVIIAAYFYLRERKHMPQKWLAAILGIAGLLLIAH